MTLPKLHKSSQVLISGLFVSLYLESISRPIVRDECKCILRLKYNIIIPSKMEVSTAMMSYDFKMSSDYNHGVLKL